MYFLADTAQTQFVTLLHTLPMVRRLLGAHVLVLKSEAQTRRRINEHAARYTLTCALHLCCGSCQPYPFASEHTRKSSDGNERSTACARCDKVLPWKLLRIPSSWASHIAPLAAPLLQVLAGVQSADALQGNAQHKHRVLCGLSTHLTARCTL